LVIKSIAADLDGAYEASVILIICSLPGMHTPRQDRYATRY
jgi:hypothetical protein